jgi:hypothetical protein
MTVESFTVQAHGTFVHEKSLIGLDLEKISNDIFDWLKIENLNAYER